MFCVLDNISCVCKNFGKNKEASSKFLPLVSRKLLGGISQIWGGVARQMKLTPSWTVLSRILSTFQSHSYPNWGPGEDRSSCLSVNFWSKNSGSNWKVGRWRIVDRGPGYTKISCAFYHRHQSSGIRRKAAFTSLITQGLRGGVSQCFWSFQKWRKMKFWFDFSNMARFVDAHIFSS